MKKYIIALAATIMTLGASAQWGIQAGANFTDIKVSDVELSKDFFKSSTGYTAGLTFDYGLPLGLGINTGLLFIQRNIKMDDGTNTALDRFSSLELPLNLKYTLHTPLVAPFAIAGPYMDCGLWAQSDGEKLKYGDDLDRITWGLTIGAGVDIVSHLRVMYQYDWGLSNLSAKDVSDAVKTKARTHRISVGLLF